MHNFSFLAKYFSISFSVFSWDIFSLEKSSSIFNLTNPFSASDFIFSAICNKSAPSFFLSLFSFLKLSMTFNSFSNSLIFFIISCFSFCSNLSSFLSLFCNWFNSSFILTSCCWYTITSNICRFAFLIFFSALSLSSCNLFLSSSIFFSFSSPFTTVFSLLIIILSVIIFSFKFIFISVSSFSASFELIFILSKINSEDFGLKKSHNKLSHSSGFFSISFLSIAFSSIKLKLSTFLVKNGWDLIWLQFILFSGLNWRRPFINEIISIEATNLVGKLFCPDLILL